LGGQILPQHAVEASHPSIKTKEYGRFYDMFWSKGPSSGNMHIKITKKHWVYI